MDFLNKAYAQGRDLLLSMTPAARIVTTLLLAVVMISLVYLFRSNITGGEEHLLAGRSFSSEELTDVEQALSTAGLQGYELDGNRIRIPRGKRAEYIAAMALGKAVPANFNEYMDEALTGSNPFESRERQQARLKQAKQKELGLILREIEGIELATVQYDVSQTSSFPRTKVTTAMVAVRPAAGKELDLSRVTSIQDLVAASIASMKREDVTVHDLISGRSWGGSSMTGDMGRGAAYATMQRQYEDDWRNKVRNALSYISGVIVSANVELDPQLSRTERSSKYDPKGFTQHSYDRTKEDTSSAPAPGGRPGSQTNSIMGSGSVTREESRSDSTETISEATKITNRDDSISIKAPLVPQRVTLSVSVPSNYYLDVWRERNPASDDQPAPEPTATDLQRIEESVKSAVEDTVVGLLPVLKPDEDPYPQVKVTTYQSITAVEEPAPELSEKAISWLGDNWSTLGMISVGLFGLLMLRSMVRSTPPAPVGNLQESPPLSMASPDDAPDHEDDEEERPRILRRSFGEGGPNLKEELTEMVREHPNEAAAILKNWISSAA